MSMRVWPARWTESIERGLHYNKVELPVLTPYSTGFWERQLPNQEHETPEEGR